MLKYNTLIICFIFTVFSFAEETISIKILSITEAECIEIEFSKDTFVRPNDSIILKNKQGQILISFLGQNAAKQKVLILGNYVDIQISIKSKTSHHLEITKIKSMFLSDLSITPMPDYSNFSEKRNNDLKYELYQLVEGHSSLGYRPAREEMFSDFDNENGYVVCVYTSKLVYTQGIPNHVTMNTEHTWPKSHGAKYEPAKSDLHHLFPTDSKANSRRGSYYFGEVINVVWQDGGSVLGRNNKGKTVFTPPAKHRGDVARSLFYFSIRYQKNIANFEESVLKKWHKDDPVDQKELRRNDAISRLQKKRNPFIDDPSLVDRINDF